MSIVRPDRYNDIPEIPISQASPSSPYMYFKFGEGTGTDLTQVETNIALATTVWPITGGGGVTWGSQGAITPDTTTDTYAVDPDFDSDNDTDASALESLLRCDDSFGTMFICFSVKSTVEGGPTDVECYVSMGDNTLSGHPFIKVEESTNGSMLFFLDDGATVQTVQIATAGYDESTRNTILFAVNKIEGTVESYINIDSTSRESKVITPDLSLITPPEAENRPASLFSRWSTGVASRVINSTGGRVASVDNMFIMKSQATLDSASLLNICKGFHNYRGDLPWAIDGV